MSRYFLEVSYKGTDYSGSQSQINANTVQAELEKAIRVLYRDEIILTGSSRTDAGVHALQNFFHFDFSGTIHPQFVYKMNAILPPSIAVRNLIQVHENAHCRFDALSRQYKYVIYRLKNPFLQDRAFYFPYTLDIEVLLKSADIIREYNDFTSFSRRNTQAKTFLCNIMESKWLIENECMVYYVKANRFLRGMVRALVATMLMAGRKKITLEKFREIIENKDCTKAWFSAPAHGLFLMAVQFPLEKIKPAD
jgi:tRNA pseudouridine38-40 synthase